jgi:hypothetical protein
MTFVFWHEASGIPLVWQENMPEPLKGSEAWRHYWDNLGYGGLFLALGAILTFVLHQRGGEERKGASYHAIDWVALSIGMGALVGTAWRSYTVVETVVTP